MRAYVHVPFCRQKCGYCKFALTPFVRDAQVAKYFGEVVREIEAFLYGEMAGRKTDGASSADTHDCPVSEAGPLETLYFGGGTPSAVDASNLAKILSVFRNRIGIAEDAEITAEANPEDLTPEYCRELSAVGVTRLSVGVQSLDDAVLATVGRKDARTTLEGLQNAFSAGFRNVNADLILGLPGERPNGTFEALRELHARFPLTHSSLYVLEAGTYPKSWSGTHADPEILRAEFAQCREFLLSRGFVHYEVSNFAKPGFASRHNLGYWQRKDCRGFGLSAASLWKGERFENAASFAGYARGEVVERETLSAEAVRLEEAMCGLRTFSMPSELASDRSRLAEFEANGWVEERDGKILLNSA